MRKLTVSPDGLWMAAGYSGGVVSVIDLRTGAVRGSWKGHEGEILQVSVRQVLL